MRLFRIRRYWLCITIFQLIIVVAIAELIELQIRILTVRIALYRLQSAEQQRLTHYRQVLRQRVLDFHTTVQPRAVLIVRNLCQTVVHDLVESLRRQLFRYTFLQRFGVRLRIIRKAGVQLLRELHIVISVDTQDIFYYVAFTLYIYTIPRYFQLPNGTVLARNLDLQRA